VDSIYYQDKHYKESFYVKMSELYNAITEDYDNYNAGVKKAAPLLKNGRKYRIKKVEKLAYYVPIVNGATRRPDNKGRIYMDIYNAGWPVKITSLDVLRGSITLSTELPIDLPTSAHYDCFSIAWDGYKYPEEYTVRMRLQDAFGAQQTYLIEGRHDEKTVRRIE
jgi:hypothetical protein